MIFFIFCMACQSPSTSAPSKPSAGLPNPQKNGLPDEPPEEEYDIPNIGCSYTIQNVRPEWTAYKFTDKTPVEGTFTRTLLSSKKTAETLSGALKGLSIEIDTTSVESNNSARNKTISEHYFARFRSNAKIYGTILAADENKGTLLIQLDMNNTKKSYTFTYTAQGSSITASTVMDMMDFGLQQPFESIHSICKTLHTGSDGIAKTWSEVGLRAVIQFGKKCS